LQIWFSKVWQLFIDGSMSTRLKLLPLVSFINVNNGPPHIHLHCHPSSLFSSFMVDYIYYKWVDIALECICHSFSSPQFSILLWITSSLFISYYRESPPLLTTRNILCLDFLLELGTWRILCILLKGFAYWRQRMTWRSFL
jgi:hypothetical protein